MVLKVMLVQFNDIYIFSEFSFSLPLAQTWIIWMVTVQYLGKLLRVLIFWRNSMKLFVMMTIVLTKMSGIR